ncbi:MAG: hypothetical protein Ta2A_26010 [Treponemataceae bacterium]|nr:MAG: hypothetical protein Ta2A_26010 [Treponemataceae bacterium]
MNLTKMFVRRGVGKFVFMLSLFALCAVNLCAAEKEKKVYEQTSTVTSSGAFGIESISGALQSYYRRYSPNVVSESKTELVLEVEYGIPATITVTKTGESYSIKVVSTKKKPAVLAKISDSCASMVRKWTVTDFGKK